MIRNCLIVFQSEVAAIKEVTTTLQHNLIKTSNCDRQCLYIFKHSKLSRSKTVIQCHKALDELAKHNTVHIIIEWIAAHVGHWDNDKEDKLAKT